jgi:hypothetical protein
VFRDLGFFNEPRRREEHEGREEKKKIEIMNNLCENSFVNFPNAQCPMPKK